MPIAESIRSIYDKKYTSCECCNYVWEIIENDVSATFNKVTFYKKGSDFTVISNDFYKGLSSITDKRSSFLCDSDCDGVAIIEEKEYNSIIFVDLKSSFSENNIVKAFRQDFFTFLKLHMMLSLCDGYQLDNSTLSFYAVCPPCKHQDDEDSIKDSLLMAQTNGHIRFIDKCLFNFFYNHGEEGFSCKIKDLPFIRNIKLRNDILSSTIVFHIVTSENSFDKERSIYL